MILSITITAAVKGTLLLRFPSRNASKSLLYILVYVTYNWDEMSFKGTWNTESDENTFKHMFGSTLFAEWILLLEPYLEWFLDLGGVWNLISWFGQKRCEFVRWIRHRCNADIKLSWNHLVLSKSANIKEYCQHWTHKEENIDRKCVKQTPIMEWKATKRTYRNPDRNRCDRRLNLKRFPDPFLPVELRVAKTQQHKRSILVEISFQSHSINQHE